MLQLRNIQKVYASGDNEVQALNEVSLNFRHNEFVSILGPSGCGKTTLLNIVGGLDRYTDGDLIIGGKSTKEFKDRDWDAYRNHTIGFVFQSYNLIPHQSVLQNVELALTLSGVPKAERRRRAKAALEQVGLGDQLRKKPSQMSGGQMQRVAIARALVNDPAIILADEPTGALDTETSVQVMELLKEVARDRLVVMVTHNPDLAEKYSTRIIRMLDGKITDDSAPLSEEEIAAEQALEQEQATLVKRKQRRKEKKPSMSFSTAFGLSLKNLFTKKGRTTLTAFAGSIGIIGIALISAVSNGMTTYIDAVQEDTLSSYPLTLEATHTDMGTLMATFMGAAASSGEHEKDAVYQKALMYELINSLNNRETKENDLKAFKAFLEEQIADTSDKNELRDAINGIQYGYDLDLLVYTKNVDGTIQRSDTEELLMDLMIEHLNLDMSGMMSMGESYGFGDMMTMGGTKLWQEILPAKDGGLINPLLTSQYDLIDGGRWPAAYNEIVLVVDENNEIDDMTLYALGLKSKEEMDALAAASKNQQTIEIEEKRWTYEEIRNMEFRVVFPFNCYQYDENTGLYNDIRVNNNGEDNLLGLQMLYDNALPLKVTGIIRPKEDATTTILTGNIAYTSALTAHIINQGQNAPVIKAQMANPDVDVTTGLPFKPTATTITAKEFGAYLSTLTDETKKQIWIAYQSSAPMPEEEFTQQVDAMMAATMQTKTVAEMRVELEGVLSQMDPQAAGMLATLDENGVYGYYRSVMIEPMVKAQYAVTMRATYENMDTAAVVAELEANKQWTEKDETILKNTSIEDMKAALLERLTTQKGAEAAAEELSKYTDDKVKKEYLNMLSEQRMSLYKAAEFILYMNKLDENGKANAYVDILVADQMAMLVEQINSMSHEDLVAFIENLLSSGDLQIPGDYQQYVEQLLKKDEKDLKETCISLIKSDTMQTKATTRAEKLKELEEKGIVTAADKANELTKAQAAFSINQLVDYYDNVMTFSNTTYEDNLVNLGKLDIDSPSTINIYASSFENKDIIEAAITDYNKDKDELEKIVYTDYVGLMMSSVTTIINAITYVLIAFVAISLVVSSIMIGVITLISVQERTKEIGILRAIGASKRNVSSMFNAETVIIGFSAGLLGVLVTYLLCIPINLILHLLTDIPNLSAILPWQVAVILVGISVVLTLFAGIIPSRSAAKKDPVVALRTE
ncbi:MAG: ABC transporter ATP-binding protein/permease [Clostridia bacterium]|nr:ABC transporter ATP-binding protein/permease [Clostridia bacterium]